MVVVAAVAAAVTGTKKRALSPFLSIRIGFMWARVLLLKMVVALSSLLLLLVQYRIWFDDTGYLSSYALNKTSVARARQPSSPPKTTR